MQKLITYTLTVVAIAIITGGCIFLSSKKQENNIEFLKSYGWEVENVPIEKETVKIPQVFDTVYTDYNLLQLQAGLNLLDYQGKSGTRYTYVVTNYPKPTKSQVRANVIVIDGTPVAGDIMTVELDGFMHSLSFDF